ncbi:MAG: hypothetical protein P0Y65_20660 [Candidatus Devosia phytovorans]|uniref:Uncharacterized protein n=1 Tax=Candidatus Devosia phytovorans TaxID=3121372 RepID=A0AAJ5VUT1_9HYPH|nr:hypothetical protein [Devosia sp.]WEK04555.1 MAG: hypothetical protein P0Y65_20660 [Devosia sp.]
MMVDIAGQKVDTDDPCAVASALRVARLQIATGGGVVVTRFGDDEVRFSSANLDRIDRLIVDYDGQCAVKNGKPRIRRAARRFTYL